MIPHDMIHYIRFLTVSFNIKMPLVFQHFNMLSKQKREKIFFSEAKEESV